MTGFPLGEHIYKKVFDEKNRIDFTCLKSFYSANAFDQFNIKYVYRGIEYYKTETGEFELKENDLLFSNSQSGSAYIENQNGTSSIGLCIHLNKKYLYQVTGIGYENCFAADPENMKTNNQDILQFLEGSEHNTNGVTTNILKKICEATEKEKRIDNRINFEWLLSFAAIIVKERSGDFIAFSKIQSKKNSTKKEILRRLTIAKQFMDDMFLENPSIPEIARISLLSEYHFFRSFKSAFGITPYQYMLNKRLDFAKELIQVKNTPVYIAASSSGFANSFALSKAFYAKYKMRPGWFKKN